MFRYTTKWPYFQNLNFLENIVSVRGSNLSQNNGTGDFNNETSEYTVVSERFFIILANAYQKTIKTRFKIEEGFVQLLLSRLLVGILKPIIVAYWNLIYVSTNLLK